MGKSRNAKDIITIPFDDTKDIVAEKYSYDGEHTEITIYFSDKSDGTVFQDIALIRRSERDDCVECLVWGNENNEDYTDRFDIHLYNHTGNK